MPLPRSIRLLIAMAVLVLSLAALLLVLTISEVTLNIHARLLEAPGWLRYAWWGLLAAASLLVTWLLWRILRPRRPSPGDADSASPAAPTAEQLNTALERAEEHGADTAQIRRELAELQRRRVSGEIHVALFGEISTGKSALVRALLPDAQAHSDVRGGTTRDLTRYQWRSPGGDVLLITDMPGTGEADGSLDRVAADEAKRAHIVIYVTDGDLNRAQHAALQELLGLRKPLLLVLNKTDRYSAADVERLAARLRGLIEDRDYAQLVQVSAATRREVVRQLPDGSEQSETRAIAPQVQSLALALQRMLDGNQAVLERLRDSATFVLAAQQLDEALAASRRVRADKLVDGYAVKAVFGALAAITPGSDLLIQGYLGTQLVRDLAALYETKVGKVDTELLLRLVQQHAGRAHTLLLAVAGNALKAFPGVGTLAGGALHAVAYGIIFRTLGRALTTTLATRGELHPRQAAKLFEEKLGEDLETSARGLARLVIEQAGKTKRD
ncbi:MAG: 50S ribosome-binding GTPase [Chromatiaceae bacterium]|nr:50S ribosome-binding GTPase [Chromatiaceae bacterium]